jgi:hypothetical protein
MEGRLDIETSHRPCGRISRSLAFAAMRKGEARMRRSKGPKPLRRTPLFDSPARRETPTVLIPSNRRIRTRMSGGVGGEEPRGSPLSRSLALCRRQCFGERPLCAQHRTFARVRLFDPKRTLDRLMSGALQKVLRCGRRGSSYRESRQECSPHSAHFAGISPPR